MRWGERGRRVKRAPVTAPSQPISDASPPLAPPSRWTTSPIAAGGAWPGLAALPDGLEPARPWRRPAGLFLAATYSLQVAERCHVFQHLTLLETPSSQSYVIAVSKVPFLPGKILSPAQECSCHLLALSKPEGIFLHLVGALGGAVGARPCMLPSQAT